jgi:NADPH:quinone reductase-like Zn-dependent oxidoreductase
VLHPQASLVLVGGLQTNRVTGPLVRWRWFLLAARLSGRTARLLMADITKADLEVLRELLETGKVTPVIDRRYKLDEIADALRYLGNRHAQGKVVITL